MSLRFLLIPASLAPLTYGMFACSNPSSPAPPAGAVARGISTASAVAVSGRNVRVLWKAHPGATVVIERQEPGGETYAEVARKDSAHGRYLDVALQPLTLYRYRLTACDASGCGEPILPDAAQTPSSILPNVALTVSRPEATDDLLAMGVATLKDDYTKTGLMMAVDRAGRIVWEHANNKEGLITELEVLTGGRLAAEQLVSLVDLDLDGSQMKKFTDRLAHHALDELSDGRFATVTFDRFTPPGKSGVLLGDGIVIINSDWTKVQWEWLARDHIPLTDFCPICIKEDPYHLGYDWTHANALTFDDSEEKIYLAVRNLNRIYRIDYPTGSIDWIMGDGGDFGAGLWSHCHSPEYLPGNRVLMLDNGLHRAGGAVYSRVIEIAYDPDKKQAEIVWEYRETPDFYAFALGSVHRESNGNTVIALGALGRILEVTPNLTKVWEMHLEGGWGTYKAITLPKDFFSAW